MTTNTVNVPYRLLTNAPTANRGVTVAKGPWALRGAVREQPHYGVDWIRKYSTEDYRLGLEHDLVTIWGWHAGGDCFGQAMASMTDADAGH